MLLGLSLDKLPSAPAVPSEFAALLLGLAALLLLAWPASSKSKPVDAAALASHIRTIVGTACKTRLLSPGGGSPATRRGLSRLSSDSPAALDHAWTSLQDVRAAAEERERAHTEAIEQLELAHARKLSEFATFAAGCLQLARSPSSLSYVGQHGSFL